MSKTAFLFLGVYGICLVGAFVFPPMGVWGYVFEWYYHPPTHWWGGPLKSIGDRWSMYIGAAMLLSVLANLGKYSDVPFWQYPQTKLGALFVLNAYFVSLALCYPPAARDSWMAAENHVKQFILFFCIVKTHSNPRVFPVLLYVSIFGCVQCGWDTTFGNFKGRSVSLGWPNMGDENAISAHAVAFLPLMALYCITKKGFLRWFCLIGSPLVLNIVAHSQSRGAFLGLIGAFGSMFVVTRGKLRKWIYVLMALGALASLRLLNDQFWDRQNTISAEEGSANGRIEAWKAAIKLCSSNPLGYGAEAFDLGLGEALMHEFHTTHNMFFECLVAWGVQGTILLFSIIFISLWQLWKLQRGVWDGVQWPPPPAYIDCLGIFCGLCSMLVTSFFLNRLRWEQWWIFAAMVVCRHVIVTRKSQAGVEGRIEPQSRSIDILTGSRDKETVTSV